MRSTRHVIRVNPSAGGRAKPRSQRFTNTQIALAALGVSAIAGVVWFLGRPQHYYLWAPPPGFTVQGQSVYDPSGNLFATIGSGGYLSDAAGNRMTHTSAGTTVPVRIM